MERFEKILLVAISALMVVGFSAVFYGAISFESTKEVKGEDMIDDGSIKRLSLDNHEYIMVYQSKGIAVVHNEACKCKKN